MNLLWQIFAKFKVRKDSEPEANNKKRHYSSNAIDLFFQLFILFHFLVGIASVLVIIVSYWRSRPEPVPVDYGPPPHPIPSSCWEGGFGWSSKNLYEPNFAFDFHAFFSENETNLDLADPPIWSERNLIYGDRSFLSIRRNVSISEVSPVMPC